MFIDYYRADPADIAMNMTCQLKAGQLISNVKRGKITREKVQLEIENHPEAERECLRAWCNHYRRVAVMYGEMADK
ncbi:hypothetical protein [Aeromonas sp. SCS5]|uniref:hypothetical protein n=1 Tax=Aeromonas sp. SCS5 TaxID=1519205 RepID=UPI00090432A5|nr:hypothetical protein [Aeromonas sp. SCS5]